MWYLNNFKFWLSIYGYTSQICSSRSHNKPFFSCDTPYIYTGGVLYERSGILWEWDEQNLTIGSYINDQGLKLFKGHMIT